MLKAGRLFNKMLAAIESEEDAQKRAELFAAYKDSLGHFVVAVNAQPEVPKDVIQSVKGAIQE